MGGPKDVARQILQAWMHDKDGDDAFPVNCKKIAEGFEIIVKGDKFEDAFQGGLFIQPGLKAILYNENIREDGRKNFTIAHELGHFFLHKDKKELKCSIDDLENLSGDAPHSKHIEAEANAFAASLLMPAADIAKLSKSENVDMSFITYLSTRYETSLTATACRVTELLGSPMAVIMVEGRKIIWSMPNSSFSGFYIKRNTTISHDVIESMEQQPVPQETWFPDLRFDKWELTQSARFLSYYGKTLVLLRGRRL